jgi:hypothetical protein
MSNTVAINQTYSVSSDLTTITIDLILPFSGRRLQSAAKINAGDEFTFTLTQVKNAYSTEPSATSLKYSSYTDGQLMEQLTTGVII